MINLFSSIMQSIPTLQYGEKFILGIDGLSRSGKTTCVKHLGKELEKHEVPYVIFHIDDYIVERNKRYHTGREEWFEYCYLQWDIDWLQDYFFRLLKINNEITLPFYKDETDTHETKCVTLPKTGIIIIEGVFLQREEWKSYFDFVLYLDCPKEKQFLRERKETQQNIKKFQERYWKAEEYYIQAVSPAKVANLVLHG
nr:kinase [Bacillus manliponensis]